MVLNALKWNLDPEKATGDSIVMQGTCQVVSSELVTITIDVNELTNTPPSFQVLQQPPIAARDFTIYRNVLVIGVPYF